MNTSANPEIIGIAGTFASGKDLLARYLSNRFGYSQSSTSEAVRNVAMKLRGSTERPVLQEVATEYRKTHGADIFVKLALDELRPTVVTGLRSLGEATAVKNQGGIVVFIDAPIEVRYERMISRGRDAEVHINFEEFKAREQKEWHAGDDDTDFNLRDIKATADFVFDSSLPKQDFIDHVLGELKII